MTDSIAAKVAEHRARTAWASAKTRKQTAQQLAVCLSTLDAMARRGDIKPLRWGRTVRFSIAEIDRVLSGKVAA